MERILEVWTDGACKGNPGPGGWGVLMRWGEASSELSGGVLHTTNNRMELSAAIQAFKAIKRPVPVRIHLDSEYVRKGITEWIHKWKADGRIEDDGVENADLWRELDALVCAYGAPIEWLRVKGHSGDPDNERADRLANIGISKVCPLDFF